MTVEGGSLDASVQALSRRLLGGVDELGARMAEQIRREDPVYRDGHVPPDDLRVSCRDNLAYVLTRLAGNPDPGTQAPSSTGRRRAEQDVPLPAVLHAYRVGGRFIWESLMQYADDTAAARDGLLRAAGDVWVIIDEYSEALTEAYQVTMADRARRNAHARAAALNGLLDGGLGEGTRLWESATMLHLPQHGTFVVVAAEAPAPGQEALPAVESSLRSRDVRSAWRLDTRLQVGIVSLRTRFPVTRLCQHLETLAVGRVGVSPPFGGLAQTPVGLQQARLACAAATPRTTQLVRYEQEPVAVLLAGAPEPTGQLVRAVLGPVLELQEDGRRLLVDTLRAWLEEAGSTSRAAERLHVHRNTVSYRLRQVEKLTGRTIADPVAVSELHLALEGLRILDIQGRTTTT